MKVIVTGGAGYIGSHTAKALSESGYTPIVYDSLSAGFREAVRWGPLVHGDVRDTATLTEAMRTHKVEAVIHFASLIEVGRSTVRPDLFYEHNVTGTLSLLNAMREAGVGRLVFSSTAAVYGNPTELPVREDAVKDPTSTYGATKLAVDLALTSEAVAHRLAAVSLRYFNVAGAYLADGVVLGERHDPETHLIPLALEVAAGRREKLQLFGDDYPTLDGTCVRDYIHIADLARAHLLALAAATPGRHRIFNLGNGTGFTNRQVIEAVREVTGHPVPVEMAPRREGDPAELVASAQRAREELGWTPARPTLHEMVRDAWAFYQAARM